MDRSPVLIAALLLGACSTPVGVTRSGFDLVFAERSHNVLNAGVLSAASVQTLASAGLQDVYKTDPDAAMTQLQALGVEGHERAPFVVLAELRYLQALRSEAPEDFLAAAIDAYLYLLCDDLNPPADPFDPGYRLACDIYNRALARALLEESGAVDLSDRVFETPACTVEIVSSRPGFPWSEKYFARFLPADAFQVRGLRERVRSSGMGVPLIAIRNEDEAAAPAAAEHMGASLKLAATAVLELEGGLEALRAGRIRGALKLYLATDARTVRLGGHEVPLETDLTVPLAYSLEDSQIYGFSISGFMDGSSQQYPPGVYLVQPYQRGKIPIVLVHGTASNPAVWAQMLNGMLFSPELRSRFQIWVAIYHTGTPILVNASSVRTSLVELVRDLDPGGTDAAMQQMMIVGHSQGGLVARLLVTSSGDRIWEAASDKPFDEYPLPAESRELLRQAIFFEPLPFVKRVVYISTPHGGSHVAGGWIGDVSRRLITLPKRLTDLGQAMSQADLLPAELRKGMPDSVMNMKPDSLFVRLLPSFPFGPGVHMHSIVSVSGTEPLAEDDDGVVQYRSAHLEEAESEFVVHHGHSCQNEPETIREVCRIMFEHLASIDAGTRTGTPQ